MSAVRLKKCRPTEEDGKMGKDLKNGDEKEDGEGGVDIVHEIWGDFGRYNHSEIFWEINLYIFYIIRYPLFINLLISLMNFPIAWQMLSMPFLAPKSDFWCERPEEAKDIWCGYFNKFELVKIISFLVFVGRRMSGGGSPSRWETTGRSTTAASTTTLPCWTGGNRKCCLNGTPTK